MLSDFILLVVSFLSTFSDFLSATAAQNLDTPVKFVVRQKTPLQAYASIEDGETLVSHQAGSIKTVRNLPI